MDPGQRSNQDWDNSTTNGNVTDGKKSPFWHNDAHREQQEQTEEYLKKSGVDTDTEPDFMKELKRRNSEQE